MKLADREAAFLLPNVTFPPAHICTRRHWLGATAAAGLGLCGLTNRLSAAGLSRYREHVLSKKPVGYWRLGETDGRTG